jgi:hypothetical protein
VKCPVHQWEGANERRAILEKLKAGVLVGVARYAQLADDESVPPKTLLPVARRAWKLLSDDDEYHFWKEGNVIAEYPRSAGYGAVEKVERYFDVRLAPNTFLIDYQDEPSEQAPVPGPPKDRADLSEAEAERFCRAMLEGWPNAGQDFAHDKAVLFFPDSKVPRDWFRSIFRSTRGPTKPGPKGK